MTQFEPLLGGLCFSEGPRWRDGRLFFSDMHAHWVMAVDESGNAEKIVEIPNQPSGLGWRPDGTMLVVSMTDRKIIAVKDGKKRTVADLGSFATWHCNDMVVDARGRAYVGHFGFDLFDQSLDVNLNNLDKLPRASLILVDENDWVRVAAEDLGFPNGTVITPDGKTLIVAESMTGRLTAFDIADNGSLLRRRTWAQLVNVFPDGICLDEAGGIWIASPMSNECLRIEEGGSITHRIAADQGCFACMLGGADGRTLFACTAVDSEPKRAKELKSARIDVARAPFAGAGLP